MYCFKKIWTRSSSCLAEGNRRLMARKVQKFEGVPAMCKTGLRLRKGCFCLLFLNLDEDVYSVLQ